MRTKFKQTYWIAGLLGLGLSLGGGCGDDEASANDDDAGTESDGETVDTEPSGSSTSPTEPGSSTTDADTENDTETGPDAEVEVEYLTPLEHLTRASMALRGIRPSAAEIAAVEADPGAIEGLVDDFVDSPEFGATVREIHNEAFLVTPDYAYYPAGFPTVVQLEGEDFYRVNRSIMEAPLRLIEYVVMGDLPYSEIVTADYTLANDVVAVVWGLDHPGGRDWEVTAWSDGRENAGVLADSWLYQRHRSTASNANRGRANVIASALLCSDFLSIDVNVDVSIDLSDPEAVANAVLQNPSCAACHETLDPLASYFRGFFPLYVPEEQAEGDPPPGYPMETPYVEDLFPDVLDVPQQPPAFYGNDGDGLAFLGAQISADPRFAKCAARRFYGYLHQTPIEEIPDDAVETYEATFEDADLSGKELAKAIVLADEFRIARVVPADPDAPTDAELELAEAHGLLKTRPTALASMVEDLTGFEWIVDLSLLSAEIEYGQVPMLEDSFLGYGVLAGGIDSTYVTQASHTYNGTTFLVLDALAREAAHAVVQNDLDAPGDERRLFTEVDPDERDEGAIRAQLAAVYVRLYAERVAADSAEVDELLSLWNEAVGINDDPVRAWKTTLTAMFQDIRVAFY